MTNKLYSLQEVEKMAEYVKDGGVLHQLASVMRENERLRETLTIIDIQALNVMQDDVPPYGAILKCGWVHDKCKEALSYKESDNG